MAIINRNRANDPYLDQIAWAEHALEEYDVQLADGVERPVLSESLVEQAQAIGGIPVDALAFLGLRAVSRTADEYHLIEAKIRRSENG